MHFTDFFHKYREYVIYDMWKVCDTGYHDHAREESMTWSRVPTTEINSKREKDMSIGAIGTDEIFQAENVTKAGEQQYFFNLLSQIPVWTETLQQ